MTILFESMPNLGGFFTGVGKKEEKKGRGRSKQHINKIVETPERGYTE